MLPVFIFGMCACLSVDLARMPITAVPVAGVASSSVSTGSAGVADDTKVNFSAPGAYAAGKSDRLRIWRPAEAPSGSNIARAPDGLFYVTALVNGAPVRFVVDTGATMVVLRAEDALRAGIMPMQGQRMAYADTANGRTSMARVRLSEVVVGGTRAQAVEAAVASGGGLPVSLLGQNWLKQLSSLTISGDSMTFN